jgi:hypothetical protein
MAVANRIICLNIQVLESYPEGFIFPLLECLRIHLRGTFSVSHFNVQHMPNLRHLLLWNTFLDGMVDVAIIPPLVSLALCVSPTNTAWIDLIRACHQTLNRLALVNRISLVTASIECKVSLPNLDTLEVWNWSRGPIYMLQLHTPRLRTYVENAFWVPHAPPAHTDVGTAEHLRLTQTPNLIQFPHIIHLQYEGNLAQYVELLDQLCKNPSICPRLHIIELYKGALISTDIPQIREKESQLNIDRAQCINVIVSDVWTTLPGTLPLYVSLSIPFI